MIVDKSEEGRQLFDRILERVPTDVREVIYNIVNSPRIQLNWDTVYRIIIDQCPEFGGGLCTIANVEASLETETGYSGFSDMCAEAGVGYDELLTYDELIDLLYEYNDVCGLGIDYDTLDSIVRFAFRL